MKMKKFKNESRILIFILKELFAVSNSQISQFSNLPACGQWWIRTTEVEDSGFTVRSIWPLW
jgi:hypothetical protein